MVNPALTVKLSTDFGVDLPTIDELDESDLGQVLDAVRRAIGPRSGWSVHDRVVLTTFTFHKEAMYRDLLDNEEVLAQHPLIQALALCAEAPGVPDSYFEPVPEDQLDTVGPPEDLLSVVDADSSQRQCILAAKGGSSFVMDGPPGTGKSQTITNLVAELIGNGETVLFVSEKAAALDVVRNRLRAVGLTAFALELHSHKATRKAVAHELGRALVERPRGTRAMSVIDRASLKGSREALSAYAQSLNEVRQPLGRSLQHAVGRVVSLQRVPQAPLPGTIDASLSPEAFNAILSSAERLGRSWAPVARGDEFLWRDVVDSALSAARRQQIGRDIDEATEALGRLQRVVDLVDDEVALGLPDRRLR